ncbi:MAG: ABC transporter substrate-binding protein [Lachnospiraceae bacterium]|nr:ABC transporter substrate-binding protein [Lachnospiraceae bacterium]
MKKKVMALLLAATMGVMTFAGCDSAESDVYNIGICQLVEHAALDAATQGFQDALTEKLGAEKVNFNLQNAQGEQTTAATICNGFVSEDVDLILANATSPLQAAAAATTSIPILGTSVTDYGTALEIADWTGSTGRNISGTSDLAPIEQQEDMLVELFPNAQQVGLLYCSAEANSVYQIDIFKAALEADGIAYKEFPIADTNEVQAVVTAAIGECDVLYIPTDNTLASCTETVYNVVNPAKIPVIAGEEGICSGCGVATLAISYYDLGYATGEMAYEILVEGADVSTMDVRFAPNVTKKYNAAACADLGITVPEDYVAIGE